MYFKKPENNDKYFWTNHSIAKMMHYGLTPQRVVRVIRNPERIEEGIAEDTIAVMQPVSKRKGENGKKTWKSEIWAMYQVNKKDKNTNSHNLLKRSKIRIISAWKYPGVTSKESTLPERIIQELSEME